MTKSESDLKSALVKEARAFGDYARRIEDKHTVGMPDILYRMKDDEGPCFLIEAKLITGPYFAPSPRQLYELELWEKAGGKGALLGFANGLYYLHHVDVSAIIKDCMESDYNESFPLFIRRYLSEQ